MQFNQEIDGPEEIFSDVLAEWFIGLEKWCIVFNEFSVILFKYLKFIFAFILFLIGILTFLKLRGIHLKVRTDQIPEEEDRLTFIRITLASFYMFFSLGILFNYFTYLLIIILDPLPDGLIFNFINFYGGIDPETMVRISDITQSQYPHEKTIYYGIAYVSMMSFLTIVISVWYLINSNRLITNPSGAIYFLISGMIEGILAGFTTCLTLFL